MYSARAIFQRCFGVYDVERNEFQTYTDTFLEGASQAFMIFVELIPDLDKLSGGDLITPKFEIFLKNNMNPQSGLSLKVQRLYDFRIKNVIVRHGKRKAIDYGDSLPEQSDRNIWLKVDQSSVYFTRLGISHMEFLGLDQKVSTTRLQSIQNTFNYLKNGMQFRVETLIDCDIESSETADAKPIVQRRQVVVGFESQIVEPSKNFIPPTGPLDRPLDDQDLDRKAIKPIW